MGRFARSVGHALAGINWLVLSQPNVRIHLALTMLALGLALWLGVSEAEWAVLLLTIGLVLVTEAVNTAIEATVDLVSPERQALARIAKDTAAGAVLIAAVVAVGVGLALFAGRLLTRLGWGA